MLIFSPLQTNKLTFMTDTQCCAIPEWALFRGNLTISNFALAPETLVTVEMTMCANSSVHCSGWMGLRTMFSLAAVYVKTCHTQGVCIGFAMAPCSALNVAYQILGSLSTVHVLLFIYHSYLPTTYITKVPNKMKNWKTYKLRLYKASFQMSQHNHLIFHSKKCQKE